MTSPQSDPMNALETIFIVAITLGTFIALTLYTIQSL